jgi:hypothetical protein
LIPYTLSFFLVAAPTYIAEISLGQYMTSGVVQAWNMIPVFQGKHLYIIITAEILYYQSTLSEPFINIFEIIECTIVGYTRYIFRTYYNI